MGDLNGSALNMIAVNAPNYLSLFPASTVADVYQTVGIYATQFIAYINQDVSLRALFSGVFASIYQNVRSIFGEL